MSANLSLKLGKGGGADLKSFRAYRTNIQQTSITIMTQNQQNIKGDKVKITNLINHMTFYNWDRHIIYP